MFIPISTKKFTPTKAIIINCAVLPSQPADRAIWDTVSIKNTKQPSRKIPVFMTGHMIAAAMTARYSFETFLTAL